MEKPAFTEVQLLFSKQKNADNETDMVTTYQLGYNSKVIKHRGISIVTFFNILATCSSTGRAMILIIRYGFDSHQHRLKKKQSTLIP